ncbi:MAG TPA: S41 family peptidase [Rubrobacteraceae bacterium]|nr:S41 family peptidase [Rubrobacteraceae bacterium]
MFKNTSAKFNRASVVRILALVLLVLAVALGAYLFGRSQSPAGLGEADQESLRLYAEALDVVQDDYVDQGAIKPRQQTYAAIEGMLDSLGDGGHTRFLTPEERQQNRRGLSGTYVGVGIQLESKDGDAVVAAPIEGSPAEQAGVQTGDVIVAVNGESVRNQEISRIAERVRGPEGTEVEIIILRDEEEREFVLERSEIQSPVVSWNLISGTNVAHVRLASFTNDSAEKLQEAFGEAREAGAERFILDLRNNPGGRLDQAVGMAGQFLEPDSVVYIRQDASGDREEVRVSGDAEPTNAPLAVLVNNGSASSSEILAGALRDNGRAPVIGTTTFGTGTVLKEFTLDDGSSILLGIAEWLTPDGDFIRESGIEPDIKVKLGEDSEPITPPEAEDLSREEVFEEDAQLRRAFEELESQ